MSRSGIDRPVAGRIGGSAIHLVMHGLAACALLVALAPSPAQAQFGRLKKLKEKFSAPDSAARAKDSLEQIAAGVKPESVKVGKSMLQRGASMVSTANGAIESATGISAKDAALAATGVGAGNLVAKKLGLDPFSIGAQALANAKMGAQQRAIMQAGGAMPGSSAMAGKAGMMDAASMAAMQRAAMGNAVASTRANRAAMANAMAGSAQAGTFTQADAEALVAFQQEMMQVSMAASAGDAGARARLEAWQAIAMKYQAEAQRLSLAAGAGDMAAVQKLQRLQLDMVRDWTRTGTTKAARRVK